MLKETIIRERLTFNQAANLLACGVGTMIRYGKGGSPTLTMKDGRLYKPDDNRYNWDCSCGCKLTNRWYVYY